MPMEYSDEVVVGAVERVKAGETVKAVSRDLRIPPKRIRAWVAEEQAFRRLKKLIDDLPPEHRVLLEGRLQEELAMLEEEDIARTAEQYVGDEKPRKLEGN